MNVCLIVCIVDEDGSIEVDVEDVVAVAVGSMEEVEEDELRVLREECDGDDGGILIEGVDAALLREGEAVPVEDGNNGTEEIGWCCSIVDDDCKGGGGAILLGP